MKTIFILITAVLITVSANCKTLIAYYSYTQNTHAIVTELTKHIESDVVRIQPAEKGLDYADNNYAIGTAQLTAIQNNPNDLASYPAIDPVSIDFDQYNTIIIATPLWWSQMAAPFQTFLFMYGKEMADKNIGVIVSSASSGISGVVADAKRLIPQGNFIEPNLWIRSSQTSSASTLIQQWLIDIDYNIITNGTASIINGTFYKEDNMPKVFSVGSEVFIQGINDSSEVIIYDTNGKLVKRGTGCKHSIPGKGLYIVVAENKTVKFIL